MGLLLAIMALSGIWNIFMPMSAAVDPNCDFYQQVGLGQQFYIHNSDYPNYYGPSTSCRWLAQSPIGTRIVLSCEDIEMPSTPNCNGDRLSISLTGDVNFNDAHNYCGKGSVSHVSVENSLAVGLRSSPISSGGRFVCAVTAIQDEPVTTEKPNSCDCGWKHTTRIVGGKETGIHEYPAMAALIDLSNRDQYCGATIISEWYLLTAAHCVLNRAVQNIAAVVGDHDLSTGNDTDQAQIYTIQGQQIYPDYNSDTQLNDLAILKTSTAIKFSLFVGPACLPLKYSNWDFLGRTVTALGWGQLEYSGPKSDVLMGVDLTIISNTDCQSRQSDPVTNGVVCTYAEGKDSCLSDSGGPLFWYDTSNRRLQLVGVISHGLGCATSRPALNTRITSYLSWIISQTTDAKYCIK